MPSTVLGQKWAEEKRRAGPNGRGRALGFPLNVLGQQHSHCAGPTHPLYSPNLRLSRENFNFPWIFMFQPPEKLPLWALLPSCHPSMRAPRPHLEGKEIGAAWQAWGRRRGRGSSKGGSHLAQTTVSRRSPTWLSWHDRQDPPWSSCGQGQSPDLTSK